MAALQSCWRRPWLSTYCVFSMRAAFCFNTMWLAHLFLAAFANPFGFAPVDATGWLMRCYVFLHTTSHSRNRDWQPVKEVASHAGFTVLSKTLA